jgi:non-homologous end joining protein Ku
VQRTQVIDLMDALKQSLESRTSKGEAAERKPAAKAKSSARAPKERKKAAR